MSFVKIHPHHTSEIQCPVLSSVLGSSIDTPTPWASTMLATPFFILPQWNITRHIVCRQAPYCFFYFEKGVGSIMTKWMKPQEHKEANSYLLPHCPPHLGTNGQIFQLPNCPQQELQNQIDSQDFSVEISRKT